jgi:hypothetical protein
MTDYRLEAVHRDLDGRETERIIVAGDHVVLDEMLDMIARWLRAVGFSIDQLEHVRFDPEPCAACAERTETDGIERSTS